MVTDEGHHWYTEYRSVRVGIRQGYAGVLEDEFQRNLVSFRVSTHQRLGQTKVHLLDTSDELHPLSGQRCSNWRLLYASCGEE